MRPDAEHGAPAAGLARRALSLAYEVLLLAAVLLAGSLPLVMLTHGADRVLARVLLQFYLAALAAAYFILQWRRGGQTLPMKTWHLRLVTREGGPLTRGHAVKRFLCALPGTLFLGAGFLWALVDRERLFLHDRLAGTKIIRIAD